MTVIIQVGKRLRRYSHRQQERLANLTSVLQETVYGIRVVKAFAMEAFERRKFYEESERLFREIGELFGKSTSMAQKLVHAAREKVRRCLERKGMEP